MLSDHFVREAARNQQRSAVPTLSPAARARLAAHEWPGNIRELKNVIERAVLLTDDDVIDAGVLRLSGSLRPTSASTVLPTVGNGDQAERARILEALTACGGNQSRAARVLRISRNTLIARLDRYDFARPIGRRSR